MLAAVLRGAIIYQMVFIVGRVLFLGCADKKYFGYLRDDGKIDSGISIVFWVRMSVST